MRKVRMLWVITTFAAVGCPIWDDPRDPIPAHPHTEENDGGTTTDAGNQCVTGCDCFDDNICTSDECVHGTCVNTPTNEGCGDTVGVCRGTWCCVGEFTCFQAYDNESTCD